MRTETVELIICEFDELDEITQEKVISHWRENDDFDSSWEYSLKAFCRRFDVTVTDWSVCLWGNSFIRSEHTPAPENEETGEEVAGLRLWKWLHANGYATIRNNGADYGPQEWIDGCCPFSGTCTDCAITGPLAKFLLNPRSYGRGWQEVTFDDLIKEGLQAWLSAFLNDLEHWHSEECIREDIEANDYEFRADGSIYY